MSGETWKILIVEDLPIYVGLLHRLLISLPAELVSASSLAEGIQRAHQTRYDVAILDLGLPDSQGLETFVKFNSEFASIPVIIFSGTDDQEIALQAVQLGAQDYVLKGSYLTEGEAGSSLFVRSIMYAIERHRIQEELLHERRLLEERVAERTKELRGAVSHLRQELAGRLRYEFMINTSKDPVILVDVHDQYQAVNDAYCRLHKLPRKQIIGAKVFDIEGQANLKTFFRPRLDRALTGQADRFTGWLSYASTGERYYDISFYPFFSSRNQVSHIVVVFHDETDHKTAEDRIRHHNRRLNILRQIDQASLSSKTPQEIVKVALENFRVLVPYDRADVLFFDKFPTLFMLTVEMDGQFAAAQAPDPVSEYFQAVAARVCDPYQLSSLPDLPTPNPFETLLLQLGFSSNLCIPLYAEGHRLGMLSLSAAASNSFTEEHCENAIGLSTPLGLMIRNSQLLQELGAANVRLRNLAAWLVSAQEDERHRISLELHDEAGQFLTALKLSLNMIEAQLAEAPQALKGQFQEANLLTEEIIDKLRTLAHDLRPPGLDTVGLHQALHDYCQKIARQTGLRVNYQGLDVTGLPAHIQTNLYRMVQEALTNVVKHARANKVEIGLVYDAEQVSVEVKDDGCGFNLPPDPAIRMVGGIGLLGIHDRMEAIGGEFEIYSEPGKGTCLSVRIPLQEKV